MPRAEVGSTKHISNKIKSKGLQRLRWFCQVCEKQCRDENGFKCHVASESHTRQMQLVGEDPRKYINQYSNDFQRDFLNLLRTSHGEKSVHANRFYNEYISNKEHIHMNATKWPSLTEFVKFLGREGICRVEDTEKGLHIAWIDNSPEALKRQDALRKRERQDRGDEEREQKLIQQQIEKARKAEKVRESRKEFDQVDMEAHTLQRVEGEKIKLNFVAKSGPVKPPSPSDSQTEDAVKGEQLLLETEGASQTITPPVEEPAVKLLLGSTGGKPKNVFAAAKKNPLAGKKMAVKEQPKKMSEVERIMREELARKRSTDDMGASAKRQRIA
ncbi:MAG: hypothetical protein M1821_009000 [Bathelium mastoideum]|nr:MAG: hypothetical protein M1821_009000 [Bathelium mastoideum]KAI9684298.1 MAG: hypothetical protein M1822_005771 [Bathelium mastoideum]